MKHPFGRHLCALFLLSLGVNFSLEAQNSLLEGILVDRESRSPIAYAGLVPLGHPEWGTYSNMDGVFQLTWPEGTDSLTLRHLSYGRLTLAKADLSDTVWLAPIPIELDEVPILSGTATELWQQVIDHLEENHYHKEVTYQMDCRAMYYSPDRKVLHFLGKSRSTIYHKKKHLFPQIGGITMGRKPIPISGNRLEEARALVMWEIPAPSLMGVSKKGFKKKAHKHYDIEVQKTFEQEGKHLAEVVLVARDSKQELRELYLIDLETYGILKARREYKSKEGHQNWYEVAFTLIENKYYMTYLDQCYVESTHIDQPYYRHTISSLKVMVNPPEAEKYNFFKVCFDAVSDYKIAWDDPFWDKSSFVPWPNWVREKIR